MIKALAVILILIAGVIPVIGNALDHVVNSVYSASVNPSTVNESFDGTIMLELLNNALTYIVNGNYIEAKKTLHILSSAYIPEDIVLNHNKTLSYLSDLVRLLDNLGIVERKVESLLMGGECDTALTYENELRSLIIDVFSLKYKLIDEGALTNYMNGLLKYVTSVNIRFTLRRALSMNIDSLINYLDSRRDSVIDLINEVKKCNITNTLTVEIISSTKKVLGSHPIIVYGRVLDSNGNPVANITVRLSLIIAGYTVSNETVTDSEGYFRGKVLTPTSNTLLKVFSVPTKPYTINATLYAFAYEVINNTLYRGLSRVNVTITYFKPRITVDCPVAVDYNNPLLLNLTVKVGVPLNISVSLDDMSLGNFTLVPGANNISLVINNTTVGLHTLRFTSEATAMYIPSAYSCTFAIFKRVPSLRVSMNNIIVYPFDRLRVYAVVSNVENNNVNISVVVDGKVVYVENGSVMNATLPPPTTYLIQYHTVNLVVNGEDIDRTVFSYKVLGINPLGIVASLAVVLIGFSIGLDEYVLRLPRIILNMRRFLAKSKKAVIESERRISRRIRRIEKFVYEKISSGIVRIYWLAVKIVARIVGEPSPSETLREYLSRSKKFLKVDLYSVFEKITMLAERDLYSRHKVTREEEEKAKKMLERMHRK